MVKFKKLFENLSLSAWWIAANKEDVIFELKEPKALLKQCRAIELKKFFTSFHQWLFGVFLASGCYVGALVIACIIMAIIMIAIQIFFPGVDLSDGDSSERNISGKGILIFLGALVVIIGVVTILNEFVTILWIRYSPSTASFRNQGLLVYGGTDHAIWEEIKKVSVLSSQEESNYKYFIIENSNDKQNPLEFVLSVKDFQRAVQHFEERNIPCEYKTIDSIIEKVIELKNRKDN